MCQYSEISVSATGCVHANTREAHIWNKYTYTLCSIGLQNGFHCEESTVTEFGPGQASTRLGPCRVCETIPEAERVQAESVAEALRVYDAAVAQAAATYEAAVAQAAAKYSEADATAWSDFVYVRSPSSISAEIILTKNRQIVHKKLRAAVSHEKRREMIGPEISIIGDDKHGGGISQGRGD
jgi:hypothetical protein